MTHAQKAKPIQIWKFNLIILNNNLILFKNLIQAKLFPQAIILGGSRFLRFPLILPWKFKVLSLIRGGFAGVTSGYGLMLRSWNRLDPVQLD